MKISTPETVHRVKGHSLLLRQGRADRTTSLMRLCQENNLHQVKVHCEAYMGIDYKRFINNRNTSGASAILFAFAYGSPELADYLLEQGSSLNHRTSAHTTCLMVACSRNNLPMVKYLRQKLGEDGFKKALRHKDNCGSTAILFAFQHASDETINFLLENGASLEDRNYDGNNCIRIVCKHDNVPMMEALRARFGDGKFKDALGKRDVNGATVIMEVAGAGSPEMMDYVLACGASLDSRDFDGNNCLMAACLGSNLTMVKHLIAKVPDDQRQSYIKNRNKYGQTAIDLATSQEVKDYLNLILEPIQPKKRTKMLSIAELCNPAEDIAIAYNDERSEKEKAELKRVWTIVEGPQMYEGISQPAKVRHY